MILFLDFTDFDNVHFVFAGTRTKTTARGELVLSCAFSLPSLLPFPFVLSRFSRNLTDFFENFAENVYIPVHGGVSVPIISDFVVESSCVSWWFPHVDYVFGFISLSKSWLHLWFGSVVL